MPRKPRLNKLYRSVEESLKQPPEKRYHTEEDFNNLNYSTWKSHKGRNDLALQEIPHLFKKRSKMKPFVAWVVGVGRSPTEHSEVLDYLKRAGITNTRVHAVDIHPRIIKKIKETKSVIPHNIDIHFNMPAERPDLITCFNMAYYGTLKHQEWLAAILSKALKRKGVLLTDANKLWDIWLQDFLPGMKEQRFVEPVDESRTNRIRGLRYSIWRKE